MVITELKEGKRNPSHIHVSVDGEYAFTTSIDLVARYHLKEGAALTGEQMQELLGEALLGQAKERALSLLSYRAYSRRELVKQLRERVPEETAEAAADRMEELGYLDDADYAARYASDLYHLNVGDVVDIKRSKDSPVFLNIGGRRWFDGKMGTSSKQVAVKIGETYIKQ